MSERARQHGSKKLPAAPRPQPPTVPDNSGNNRTMEGNNGTMDCPRSRGQVLRASSTLHKPSRDLSQTGRVIYCHFLKGEATAEASSDNGGTPSPTNRRLLRVQRKSCSCLITRNTMAREEKVPSTTVAQWRLNRRRVTKILDFRSWLPDLLASLLRPFSPIILRQ
ncbi:hypothetical protein J6590_013839 [Homalodisca vitripennis]|nr:hypothetical protein J6590_013839 [Homalodisca vitripennis]